MKCDCRQSAQQWGMLQARLLWCYDATRELQNSHYVFAQPSAWLVRQGWAEAEYPDLKIRAKAGEWLLLRPEVRIQRFSPDARMCSIAYKAHWPDGRPLWHAGLPLCVPSQAAPALAFLAHHLIETAMEITGGHWDLRSLPLVAKDYFRLHASFLSWLMALSDVQGRVSGISESALDPRLELAARRVRELPWGQPLEIGVLAKEAGLSPVQLNRLFRQAFGQTARGYRQKLRLDAACQALAFPGARIKEVALQAGFIRLGHFSKWFRQGTEFSPRAYVRRMQGAVPA